MKEYDPPKMTADTHCEPLDIEQVDDGQDALLQAFP
jgi:hypothetical protein